MKLFHCWLMIKSLFVKTHAKVIFSHFVLLCCMEAILFPGTIASLKNGWVDFVKYLPTLNNLQFWSLVKKDHMG